MTRRLKKWISSGWSGWLPAIWFLVFPVCGPAAELTLSDAVEQALANNPRLEASGYGILSAEEKIIQARAGVLPQVAVSQHLDYTTNPMWAFGTRLNQQAIAAADFNPDRLNDPDGITNHATRLSVNWPVYDGGRTRHGLTQARLGHEAATLVADRTRQQVIFETLSAYNQVLLVREHQRVLDYILETAESHLSLVQSRYDGGFVAKSDLLRAQVHLAEVEQQRADAGSQFDIANCHLNVIMGMEGSQYHVLVSPLEAGEHLGDDLDFRINQAMTLRPDLLQMKLSMQMAEKEIEKSKASRYPVVNLSGNYEFNTEDFNDTASNYMVGAVVSVPLFTGGRISSGIREARVNLEQSKAMLRSMEQQVCGEVRQAFFNARSAWERIQVAKDVIMQAEESLRIVRSRYENGLFTIADLLDAEVLVQQSLTHHLRAIHDYRTALAGLDLASGTIDTAVGPQ